MSESAVGLISAVTRQNTGRFLAAAGCEIAPGGVNAPAATSFAEVIVVSASLRPLKLSHVAAATAVCALQAMNTTTTGKDRAMVRQMFIVLPPNQEIVNQSDRLPKLP